MKNPPNILLLATGALLLGTLIGALGAYVSKVILRELPPLTVLFLRLTIMVILLTPFFIRKIHTFLIHIRQLVVLGLFFVGNLIFFIVGIKTATVLASGLLYASAPITVLFLDRVMNREKLTKAKAASVVLGFIGALILLYSSQGARGLGSFQGTLLLFLATISYAFYLVYSKHLSFRLTPIELTGATTIVGWIVSGVVMVSFEGLGPIFSVQTLSFAGWLALGYLGILLGVAMYFLIQWGVRQGSASLAASMQYVGLVLTGASGVLLLGERLTGLFVAGTACIVSGLYLITIHPALRARRHG